MRWKIVHTVVLGFVWFLEVDLTWRESVGYGTFVNSSAADKEQLVTDRNAREALPLLVAGATGNGREHRPPVGDGIIRSECWLLGCLRKYVYPALGNTDLWLKNITSLKNLQPTKTQINAAIPQMHISSLAKQFLGGLKCGLLNLEWCYPCGRASTRGKMGNLESVNPENFIWTNVKTRIHTHMPEFREQHDCRFGSVINSNTTLNIWFSVAPTLFILDPHWFITGGN